MARNYPHIPFERYADDAICHCQSAKEARALWSALADRLAVCKLTGLRSKVALFYCRDKPPEVERLVFGQLNNCLLPILRGTTRIVIDDPLKLGDAMSEAVRARVVERYRSTLLSRGDDKTTTRVVVVMQRVHQNDLVGYLQERATTANLRPRWRSHLYPTVW
jgi:hypothetical protein